MVRPLADHEEAFDLNDQTLHDKPVLTWFQGEVVDGHGQGVAVIANDRYQTIAVIHGGNGTLIDLHDPELTNQGTVFVTAYRTMRWNLSSDGGSTNGTVPDGVVQEIDLKTGLVEEEWDSLDHVPVSDSDLRAPSSPATPFDYFHINGGQPLRGGDLLISSRNTSAAYEVDPADRGAVVRRLGGKASSFTMGPGTRSWYEHDVPLEAGDLVTVFDDGSDGSSSPEPRSRALVIRLDLATHRATLVHAFTDPLAHVLAYALGNVQDLPGGDYLVGWGTAPSYSVLAPTGHLLYDATLPAGDDSYRAYLHEWSATPATRPSIGLTPSGAGGTVSVSWNGATAVARWEVRSGPSATSLHEVTTVADTGFQTTARPARIGRLVQAVAVGADGTVLGRSAVAGS